MRGNGVREDEARLGHGALGRVNQQQRAVCHLEHALDLAAKVSVARGVDDVDLDALVLDGDVLGQDGDASLALLVVGVKHALLDLLVLAEGVGGLEHLVNQRGLAVVDVGNDCDVSNLLLEHGYLSSSLPAYIRQRKWISRQLYTSARALEPHVASFHANCYMVRQTCVPRLQYAPCWLFSNYLNERCK